ncbi:type I pullulanase [Haliovirga abyssi]|uniref:pullulanase n=1 Tax=Haliovirga abyssi TaxID=2996794 RepID=A0AAU9D4J0_9FUSO|nr:type I pullulanase [Haliovirga abyssi]BDU49458.1 hypothetical protein HLVA_00270 [Haliovirga abyssi]
MKKIISLFGILTLLLGCANNNVKMKKEVNKKIEKKVTKQKKKKEGLLVNLNKPIAEGTLRIHYYRTDGDYMKWGLHLWGNAIDFPVAWDSPLKFEAQDDFGAFKDIAIADSGKKLNFIIHSGGTKDVAKDRTFPSLKGVKEVWLLEGIEDAFLKKPDVNIKLLQSALLKKSNKLELILTNNKNLKKDDFIILNSDNKKIDISDLKLIGNKKVELTANFDLSKIYSIKYGDKKIGIRVAPELIDENYFYNGDDLGFTYKDNKATFKLWAPLAENVKLYLYDKNDQYKLISTDNMIKKDKGVWEYQQNIDFGNIVGYFYQYGVTINGKEKKVLDPYAKSMAAFEDKEKDLVGKAAIVNPSDYSVESYAKIPGYTKREDAIIYEVHVRDFTSDPNLKTKANFGTYRAFIEKLGYLKKLGVTHIQLMPVLNYYYSNELDQKRELKYSARGNNYNWGYDPHNYFSPEGMYSENPRDPNVRVEELKELINAIHNAGMGVILDVVYNHTAKTDIFENIVPGYYYRMTNDGNFKSKSGCGNDVATTHKMVRKLIVDSLRYWTKEYKVDGFRFDLMGLIDTKTIEDGYKAAKKLDSKTLFVGEGWKMYDGPDSTKGADQDWMNKTDDVAVFSDSYRDVLKAGGFHEGEKAFLTKGRQRVKDVFENIVGRATNFTADDPGDSVQYISAHDGLTWHDTVAYTVRLDSEKDKAEIYKRLKLGNLIVLTSQGVAFLHAGEEMGRTKEWKGKGKPEGENVGKFIRNSYDSSDIINRIDWNLAEKDPFGKNLVDYTKGLIAIRRSTDAFRLGTEELIKSNTKLIMSKPKKRKDFALGYLYKSTKGEEYYIFINSDKNERDFTIDADLTNAKILVDDDEASVNGVKKLTGVKIENNKIILSPLTATIIKK